MPKLTVIHIKIRNFFNLAIKVVAIAFIGIFHCSACSQSLMIKQGTSTIASAHTNIKKVEYRFKELQRGRGGALAVVDDYLVVGTSQNTFIKIDPKSMKYVNDYLPKIETGEDQLEHSKRYLYRELKPRIEDLIFYQDQYYVTFERYDKKTDYLYFVVATKKISDKKWVDLWQSVGLDAPYFALGTGGRMAIKDDILYFTVGDFSLDRINALCSDIAPQKIYLPWGKVITIDLLSGNSQVFTAGHRNPAGLLVLADGTILASEHGPQGGDEINILERDKNYGWPYESFGTTYGSFSEYRDYLSWPEENVEFTLPMYAFLPSPAVSQLIQVKNFHPKWIGNILLGSLKAQTIFNIRMDDKKVTYVEPIKVGERIRDLKELGGAIFILTDKGSILKLN